MATSLDDSITELLEELRRQREPEYPPAPEGQESRWPPKSCEWPENVCCRMDLPCEECPYYILNR